jgi:ribosome biogenesis GTPase
MKHYDHEEDFHSRDKKEERRSKKIIQKTDRSQFKKSNQDQRREAEEIKEHLNRGRVISITGEGSWVDFETKTYLCSLKGLLKKETQKTKNLIAVGDWVRFSFCSEKEGIIEQIEERTSFLSRSDITGKKEQLIAVNIDQAIISACIANPPLKPALIDRYLIAAERGKMHPIIVINKIDLLDTLSSEEQLLFKEFVSAYELLGFPILCVSTKTGVGIDSLRALLQNKTSVFSGQSGVGKSSLLNACFDLTLKTGDLAQKTFKGTHTTTTANLLCLPNGGYCVDTPGIRSFGIWNLTKDEIISHFFDLQQIAQECKYVDCAHMHEPECAVIKALEEGKLSPLRYQSFVSLMEEINTQSGKTWS